jgi:hypothetical protein
MTSLECRMSIAPSLEIGSRKNSSPRFIWLSLSPELILVQFEKVAQLNEAVRYKPEGPGFDSQWCHWIISLI